MSWFVLVPSSWSILDAASSQTELLAEVSDTIPAIHERTFVMVKPDGVQRGLVGKIIKRFEEKGFKLIAMKFIKADVETAKKHRSDKPKHMQEPIFTFAVNYLTMGPVVPMIWEGFDIIKSVRRMLGKTSPLESNPGTIRGDFGADVGRYALVFWAFALAVCVLEVWLAFSEFLI